MLRRERDQRLRLLLGLSFAEDLTEGPIAEERLSDRIGMGECPGKVECLVAPRPGQPWIAEDEKRMGQPVQADHTRVDGVDEPRLPVSDGIVEGEPAL
jgi:hypothetical protein